MFVDDPQSAVQQADALVSEVVGNITRMFASEHSALESNGIRAKTFPLKISANPCSFTDPSSTAWWVENRRVSIKTCTIRKVCRVFTS